MIDIVWNIVRRKQRFLLAQRSLSDTYGGMWVFPGGKVDKTDQTIIIAAARELKEEVGLNGQYFEQLCVLHFSPYNITVFKCNYNNIPPTPNCDDIIDVGWFSIADMYSMNSHIAPMTMRGLPYIAYIIQHYDYHPDELNNLRS